MKIGVFWIAFLVLVIVVFSTSFFLYTGNAVRNIDKSNMANLVLDTLYITNDNFFAVVCNNGNGIINKNVELSLEIIGRQTKPEYIINSKKSWTKNYNLVNFGRKCFKENIKIKDVLGSTDYKNSKVIANINGNGLVEIKYTDNIYEVGYYTFENGKNIRRTNKV